MAFPERMGFMAKGANTRSLVVRDKVTAPHPATKAEIVVKPTVFIHFPGRHSFFLGDAEARVYGFKGLRDFFLWFKARGEVEAGEVIYSACLGVPLEPVALLGKAEVDEEIRRRLLLQEKEPIPGSATEKAAALLELRYVGGEAVEEPRVRPPEPETVPAGTPGEEAALTDRILQKHLRR